MVSWTCKRSFALAEHWLQDEAQSRHNAAALDVLLSEPVMCHIFESAATLFTRVLERCRTHCQTPAALAQSPAVRQATERLLGMPDWRSLLQPMLAACLVRRNIYNCKHGTAAMPASSKRFLILALQSFKTSIARDVM